VIELETERVELGLVPPCADAKDEASAADRIERVGAPGDEPGVAERRAQDERTELHARGRLGQRAERRERLPDAARLSIAALDEQVIGDPDGVETAVLRQ
jgi:hypothetical protein